LGFVVDRVASVVSVDRGQIESPGAIKSTVNTELLSGPPQGCGRAQDDHGARLRSAHRHAIRCRRQDGVRETCVRSQVHGRGRAPDSISAELQFVSFEVAKQEYAIIIDDVQEIVQVPDGHRARAACEIACARCDDPAQPAAAAGVAAPDVRLPDRDADEESRIVVVSLGGASVGVVMDSVNQVLRVARSAVDRMPGLLAQDGNMSDIEEICRLDGGKRMVSILSVENMFRHSAMKAAINTVDDMTLERNADSTRPTRPMAPAMRRNRSSCSAWVRRNSACRSRACRKSCAAR
jgi:purine-binding chemotaxis protein CheW